MSVELTLERQTLRFETDTLGIGRAAENQISLPNDARLEQLHAVLKQVNGRWIIESREGGPVRIGNGRPVRFAWLNSGDVIHLTEAGPELLFQLPEAASGKGGGQGGKQTEKEARDGIPSYGGANAGPTVQQPVTGTLARAAQRVVGGDPSDSVPPFIPANGVSPQKMIVIAVSAVLIAIGIVVWTYLPRAKPQAPPMDLAGQTPTTTTPPLAPQGNADKTPVDPREFLVLIGIGDLTSGNRPHLLGVGWLWNERTAVVSRTLGDALVEVVAATKREGSPRQACVIQGVALEVGEITNPSGSPEISILRLKEPAELTVAAREAWRRVTAADIERMRQRGKSFSYVSYAPLPRSPKITGNHGFPLQAYDPELVHVQTEEARLLYEHRSHLLKWSDPMVRLERGGLLVDQDQKIIGMTVLDSSVVWTDALEKSLGN